MTDARLFSPASVTWRVHADPLVGLAGLRALLLRALHPVADDATAQRDYLTRARLRDDPWGRLRDLADAVTITTFGSAAEALTVAARARAVSGTLTGSRSVGGRWQGDDEDLLLWEHVCRVDSFLTVVRRGGLRLTDQEADDYVAEQVRAAALCGLEPDVVPSTVAALTEHLDRTRAELAVGPASRRLAQEVVSPAEDLTELPVWAGVSGLAFAALPDWARRMYALAELPGAAGLVGTGVDTALRMVRTTLTGPRSWRVEPRAGLDAPAPSPSPARGSAGTPPRR